MTNQEILRGAGKHNKNGNSLPSYCEKNNFSMDSLSKEK